MQRSSVIIKNHNPNPLLLSSLFSPELNNCITMKILRLSQYSILCSLNRNTDPPSAPKSPMFLKKPNDFPPRSQSSKLAVEVGSKPVVRLQRVQHLPGGTGAKLVLHRHNPRVAMTAVQYQGIPVPSVRIQNEFYSDTPK